MIQSRILFDDALSILPGKTKAEVYDKGANTRSLMIDAIFSLKEVCESLFGAVIDISADKISTT